MNALRCSGSEENIFQCRSHGWGVASEVCLDHSKDAEVFCYRNGKLKLFAHIIPQSYLYIVLLHYSRLHIFTPPL